MDEEPTTTEEPSSLRDAIESAVGQEEVVDQPVQEEVQQEVSDASDSFDTEAVEIEPDKQPELELNAKTEPTEAIRPGPKSGPKKQEKAPVSWRPDVREHWAKLPDSVKSEVQRREREVQQTLKESSSARKYAEAVNKVIEPYQVFIKAENSNPLQAIDNVMATAAKLRTGTAPEIAQLVSGIVKQFGVGRFGQDFISQLDGALVGEIPQNHDQNTQLQQAIQQQLQPVQNFMNEFQQAKQSQTQQVRMEAQGEVQNFIEKAEFSEDVREEMADLMEVADRRGRDLSLQDAYRQACLSNPRVRDVLQKRQKSKGAQQSTGVAQRARAAAVSVSGGPALASPNNPAAVDIRSAIESAIASNSR
tara:strand:+ start:3140 stop:4225 length:1086 start_codon:yes stop_codon:yes gene_type:complete